MEDSMFQIDGPPSSPFISQITDVNSRASSKQYASPAIEPLEDCQDQAGDQQDKENIQPSITTDLNKPLVGLRRRRSQDSDLMPPPSRKRSPLRSPLRKTVQGQGGSPKQPRPVSHAQDMDDTCFSTFSVIEDLTWTKQASPFKLTDISNSPSPTPRAYRKRQPASRSPSPSAQRRRSPQDTSLLMDFTQQMENVGKSKGLPASKTEPNLLQHLHRQRSPVRPRHSLATPAKQTSILDLLDFELPPAPTPRSVPTITVRELETLKSQYLSQISSLKAMLSGREAEVESFRRAIGDAERRVGEAQEALREEKIRREQAEQEKMDWERRGLEVENVLGTVKEEILKAESEKETLSQHVSECERRADEAEAKTSQTKSQLAEAQALLAVYGSGGDVDEQVQKRVALQIDAKIEAVSRELHAVYKEKHERKVATLKQSYEARSQKRLAEIQAKVVKLEKANDELLIAKAALVPLPAGEEGEAFASLKAEIEEQKAHMACVEQELLASRGQREELVAALEQERIEKGDLVAAVDEMLALQSEQGPTHGAMSVVEDFRKSISRPRQTSESRIARIPQSSRTPGKSKMLASIERMGRAANDER